MARGIPVPPVIPEGSKAFILCVPDDPFFYGVVMGAIKTMTFRYYWQGSTEQIDAVTERMTQMYYDYQEQVGCMICDMVAECFADGNEALIEALAEAIRNNPLLQAAIADAMAQNGSYTPGHSLTPGQSAANLIPDNVKDEFGNCIDDNLWGAMLYLVQSGNRLISDFFEVLEVLSNTIERMEVVSKAIPAAGDYISAAAGFADQLGEEIAEGYAGAYTEAYEQQLACDLFCLARSTCELSIDGVINLLNERLSEPFGLADFGEIMTGIATGSWVGDELVDVAFMVFFGALKFGQQFGDTLGVRPLPVLMSLGADQLASNNWEVLCDCAEETTLQVYETLPNFGGTLQDTLPYELGVPVVIEAINYGTIYYGIGIELDGTLEMSYTIDPDPVITTNPGEIVWLYNRDDDTTQLAVGTAAAASDMPTPVNVLMAKGTALKGAMWISFEPFTLTVTFNIIP